MDLLLFFSLDMQELILQNDLPSLLAAMGDTLGWVLLLSVTFVFTFLLKPVKYWRQEKLKQKKKGFKEGHKL